MRKLYPLLLLLSFALMFVSCGGKSKDVIRVGIIRPEIYAGEMVEKGILLAIEEINAKGGILGKKIEPIIINDENKADAGKSNLIKAIEKDEIDFIAGGMNSAVVKAAMDVMADYKKIWLGTGGASPDIIKKIKEDYNKYKYYFRLGTMDAMKQGEFLGDFIINFLGPKFGIKEVALIGADQVYMKAILGMNKKKLEDAGYKIVLEQYLPTNTTDFSPVFSQIKEKGAKIVIEGWPSAEAITFVKQFNANKVPAILFGAVIESLKDEYFAETGGACVYESSFSPAAGPAPMTSKTMAFADAFKKKYNKSAGYIAYPSYDTMYVLKAALEKVGNVKDTEAIIKALEAMEFEGNIWYKFTKDHDLTMGTENGKTYATAVWFQWKPDGSRKAIFPEQFKNAEYELAPWVKAALKK